MCSAPTVAVREVIISGPGPSGCPATRVVPAEEKILAAVHRIEQRLGMPTPATYEQIAALEVRVAVLEKKLDRLMDVLIKHFRELEGHVS